MQGVKRRSSSINTHRVDNIYQDPHEKNKSFILHYGDLTDTLSIKNEGNLIDVKVMQSNLS